MSKTGFRPAKLAWLDLSQRMVVLTKWKPRPDIGPDAGERISDANTYDITDQYWRAVDGEIQNVLKALAEAAKHEFPAEKGLCANGAMIANWLLNQELKRVD